MTAVREPENAPTYISGHECDVCGSVHSREYDVVQHLQGKEDDEHSDLKNPPETYVNQISNPINSVLFESLYVVNKHAKRFSNRSTGAYRQGRKLKAKELSNKKKALYGLKEAVLRKVQFTSEKVALHEIDGTEFYCLYFVDETGQKWSFHAPKHTFSLDGQIEVDEEEELNNFNKTTTIDNSDQSLQEALQYFNEKHHINANRFLPPAAPVFGHSYHPVNDRWGYL